MPLPFQPKPLDADAAAYIARSGATDRAAINAFVRGVKALGLWESMVCWPLRSSQNAGVGDTVYSLGGRGTFNGTRVNGPAWTTDGLTFDATNKSVQLPDQATLYNARSAMAVFKSTSSSFNQQLVEFSTSVGSSGWYYLMRFHGQSGFGVSGMSLALARGGTGSTNGSELRTIDLANFQSGTFTADDTTDNVFRNGVIEVSGARTGLSAINPTGSRDIRLLFGNSNGATGSFAIISSDKWTNHQVARLHTLYRNTIGAGLGLP